MFEDLKCKINARRPPAPASREEVDALRNEYPGIPKDYLTFLQEIGSGNLGPFILYSSPSDPEFVYGPRAENLPGIILLGDDMQGYCFGFDTEEDFQLVEIDSRAEVNYKVKPTFSEFVRDRIAADNR